MLDVIQLLAERAPRAKQHEAAHAAAIGAVGWGRGDEAERRWGVGVGGARTSDSCARVGTAQPTHLSAMPYFWITFARSELQMHAATHGTSSAFARIGRQQLVE